VVILNILLIGLGVVAVSCGLAFVSLPLAIAVNGLFLIGMGVALWPVGDRQ
jgi:hypothetical protein